MAKTTRRVRVALGEALRAVGEIVFETDGRRQTCMFRYAAEWLDAPRRFAIAPTMPLSGMPFYSAASRERPRSALPGPIADGAPDSWGRGLIRKALPGMLTELDYLLAADDVTRQGALRYLDEEGRPLARTYPPAPRLARGRRRRRAPMEGFRTGRPPADAQRPPRRTHGDGHCAELGYAKRESWTELVTQSMRAEAREPDNTHQALNPRPAREIRLWQFVQNSTILSDN